MRCNIPFLLLMFTIPGTAVAQEPESSPNRPGQGAGVERAKRVEGKGRVERGARWQQMPEAERKAVANFMQEHFPKLATEIEGLKESAPKRFERRMERLAPEMRSLMAAKQQDPRRATVMIRERQIGFQLERLVRDFHGATDDAEKEKIRMSIQETVGEEFEVRRERRNMEIKQLESKLEELKNRVAEMDSVREKTLDKRTRELLERKPKATAEGDEDGPAPQQP